MASNKCQDNNLGYMGYTKEEFIAEIHRVADELGRPPTVSEFNDHPDTPTNNVLRKWDETWSDIKEKAGYRRTEQYRRITSIDTSYFEEPFTPESAYWMGMLWGDGSVGEYDGLLRLTIGLNDGDHIEQFKRDTGSEHTVHNQDGLKRVFIFNRGFIEPLLEYGLDQEKTHSESLPPLTDERTRLAFVRGLVDADGNVGVQVKITGASKERFERLTDWVPFTARVCPHEDNWMLYTLRSEREEVYDTLWPDGIDTEPALDRKNPHE